MAITLLPALCAYIILRPLARQRIHIVVCLDRSEPEIEEVMTRAVDATAKQ